MTTGLQNMIFGLVTAQHPELALVSGPPPLSRARVPMSNPAETYESYMVPVLFAPWAMRLLQSAGIKGGESALDVGCGTGIVARRAARQVGPKGKVAAIDLSAGMLAVARAAAGRE